MSPIKLALKTSSDFLRTIAGRTLEIAGLKGSDYLGRNIGYTLNDMVKRVRGGGGAMSISSRKNMYLDSFRDVEASVGKANIEITQVRSDVRLT